MEQGKKGRPSQQSAADAHLGYTAPQVPAADLQAQQAAALQYAQVQAAYAAQQQAAAAQGYPGQVGISYHSAGCPTHATFSLKVKKRCKQSTAADLDSLLQRCLRLCNGRHASQQGLSLL